MVNWNLFFDMIAAGVVVLYVIILIGYFSDREKTQQDRELITYFSVFAYIAIAWLIAS